MVKILSICGSTREASLNQKLLNVIQECAGSISGLQVESYSGIAALPIFNQDLEGDKTPPQVLEFCAAVESSDGLLIASPEYVRAIPGGLKNAIDWLVSREEIVAKPIALVHASYRGNDMLSSLRLVLATVSERFTEEIFLCIPLQSSDTVTEGSIAENRQNVSQINEFLIQYQSYIARAASPTVS